jgi:GxxExxY protein
MNRIAVRNEDVLYPELSYKISGLCFEAQNELGRFLNEKQFCDFLETLFKRENIGYVREKPLPPSFEGEAERRNIPDFIIEDLIIFDAKAKWFITKQDYYQMQRYLNSYNKKLGIIVNFRQHRIIPRRVLNPNYKEKEMEEQKPIPNQETSQTPNTFKKFQKYS